MILIKMEKKNGKLSNSVSWTHQDMLLKYREKRLQQQSTALPHSCEKMMIKSMLRGHSTYSQWKKKSLWALGIESKTAQLKEGYNICTKLGLSCSQKALCKEWHRVPVFHAFLKTTTTSTTTSDLQPTFHVVHFWHANTVHFQQEELIPFTYFQ